MNLRTNYLTAFIAGIAVMVLTFTTFVVGNVSARAADEILPGPAPVQQRASTDMTADSLPTAQIDSGVVWTQVMSGNIVYAGGSFSNARPPGAAPGTNLVPRSNILAYDITTGELTSFAPKINGTVKSLAVSPDRKRLYVGGTFNNADGQTRWNLAAFDIPSGNLVSGFRGSVGGSYVNAIAVTDSAVYVGGLIGAGNGVARRGFAAFNVNGDLLGWAPTADLQIDAMTLTPNKDKLIVAGRFSTVNDVSQRGLAALDLTTGALLPWEAPNVVKNGWNSGNNAGKAGIWGLAVDENAVYGTGWVFADVATGNLEGTFSADPSSGDIRWIADCHGDHYGVYSDGKTVYTTSHEHACESVGGVVEKQPVNMRNASAMTAAPKGTLSRSPHVSSIYKDWSGWPAPAFVGWWPDWYTGNVMGQAGYSIVGNGSFMSVGGEFVGVNGGRQDGLARFSSNPAGGAKQAPRLSGTNWAPTAKSNASGTVRVSIPSNWDRDDIDLTYRLIRVGEATAVDTKKGTSTFWDLPTISLTDSGLTAGSSQRYYVTATDGDGNNVSSSQVSVQVSNAAPSEYRSAVLDDGATLFWPLGGDAATAAEDWAGDNRGTVGSGVGSVTPGGITDANSSASTFNGSSSGIVATSRPSPVGPAFTTELWFKSDTRRGGKLLGYGSSQTGLSSNYDRHVYMRNDGYIVFGTYPGSSKIVTSALPYNDGDWHYLAAAQGANGMRLYVDGKEVAADAGTVSAQSYSGYWRLGGDNLNGWPNAPSSNYFDGDLDEFAVYDRALTQAEVATHYALGAGIEAPTAAFETQVSDLEATFDASASTAGNGGTISGYNWNFGDGSENASGLTTSHAYAAPGTYEVELSVTNEHGLSGSTTKSITVNAPHAVPVAEIGHEASGLSVAFDGTGSSAADGATVTGYAWEFGDGGTSSEAKPVHVYGEAGSYPVKLVVTDSTGAKSDEGSCDGGGFHAKPVGAFSVQRSELSVTVDAGASKASDGATMSYAWDWGDGSSAGSGVEAEHAYAVAGSYEVVLTVTDSLGATAVTKTVDVAAHAVPVAEIGHEASGLSVAFDGTGSSAADGATVTGYAWEFGDGGTSSEAKPVHVYGEAGSYPVKLVVTDSTGAKSDEAAATVEVSRKPVGAFSVQRSELSVTVDAGASKASDGATMSYAWDWGDGSSAGSGVEAEHAYAVAGSTKLF